MAGLVLRSSTHACGDRSFSAAHRDETFAPPIPITMSLTLFFTGLFAAVLSAAMTTVAFPFAVRIAKAIRAMDYPGRRRSQNNAIPRMGMLPSSLQPTE